jgi:DNA-binding response OmpR family regulator
MRREREKTLTRILVIDDEESIRAMLRQWLETIGYEVVEAADGEAGVEIFNALFSQDPIDLVIVDAEMPKKSGLDVIQELMVDFPGVKIIAITGSSGRAAQAVRVNATTFGAYQVFAKPLLLHELQCAIEGLLDRAEAREFQV